MILLAQPAHAQRCDASQPDTTPASRYSLNPNGTVTDKTTGLMWKRCTEGQSWNGKTCSGSAKPLSLVDAAWLQQANAKGKSQGGFTDWRLPTQDELLSLVQSRCSNPAINLKAFPATASAFYWTSTQGSGTVNSFWTVDFKDGFDSLFNRGQTQYVRLVRKP